MFFNNLLGAVTSIIPSIGEIANISVRYEWICNIISAIIGFAGDVGLGIILFTVILKIITLAPDIWSRASMKKNALKMEAMKEDLEKLQKQYAKRLLCFFGVFTDDYHARIFLYSYRRVQLVFAGQRKRYFRGYGKRL